MSSEASVFIDCLAGKVRKRLQHVSLIGGVDVVDLDGDGRGIISRDRNGVEHIISDSKHVVSTSILSGVAGKTTPLSFRKEEEN